MIGVLNVGNMITKNNILLSCWTPLTITNSENIIMNKHILSQSTWYFTIMLLMAFMLLVGQTQWVLAANLRIEPPAPIIAVRESIPLTVRGARGKVTWQLPQQKGEIQV